ncbi:MAG: porphobilinogen synthase [Deltaproteobacteria bacterium]|nr:MAG: porphobilinogen synthase [Deltaproteobacteria bacterium]
MMFPEDRPRRLRRTETIRRMVRETRVFIDDLVYPLFIKEGKSIKEPIGAMPGQFRYSIDMIKEPLREVLDLGIPAVLLFGIPNKKDPLGREAYKKTGIVQKAIKTVKDIAPELAVITDVCMCEYTDHGHCGILTEKGEVSNDDTLEVIARIALSHADAGADIVAPSGMMDGGVGAIRDALDEGGFEHIPIMSYAIKYASAFYGPFREAADSSPAFGDRKGYQMDPANVREALREAVLDIEEGTDFLMVKPAMPYLDVLRVVSDEFDTPIAAYQVSGEYAMIKAAAANGWLDEDSVLMESVLSIKRAGADIIITYFAPKIARLIA